MIAHWAGCYGQFHGASGIWPWYCVGSSSMEPVVHGYSYQVPLSGHRKLRKFFDIESRVTIDLCRVQVHAQCQACRPGSATTNTGIRIRVCCNTQGVILTAVSC